MELFYYFFFVSRLYAQLSRMCTAYSKTAAINARVEVEEEENLNTTSHLPRPALP